MSPHSPEIEALKQQLERLERSHRRLKSSGVAALLVGACLLFMAQARPPRVIEAEKFILRDSNGKVRAKLESDSYSSRLLLLDTSEKTKVQLESNSWNETLVFSTPTGKPRVGLFATRDSVALHFYDYEDDTHNLLLSAERGQPRLELSDTEGSRAVLSAGAGIPALSVSDPAGSMVLLTFGQQVGQQARRPRSFPKILLLDPRREVLWSTP